MSETSRLLAPLEAAGARRGPLTAALLALLTVGWLGSGWTVVGPDEVGIVLRAGRVVGSGPDAIHPPGLLMALPRPIDDVIRVKTRRVWEVEITTLHHGLPPGIDPLTAPVDPERTGYALTGDRNVVQTILVARFQIDDPIAWALSHADPEAQVSRAVEAATVQCIGETEVDVVLGEGRDQLLRRLLVRAQQQLDTARLGVQLVAVELVELAPALQVMDAFEQVQSAYITAETRVKEAERYRATTLPAAEGAAGIAVKRAEVASTERMAEARGGAAIFTALAAASRPDPEVFRERIYRERIEHALGRAGTRRFVPPPSASGYDGLRITIGSDAPPE